MPNTGNKFQYKPKYVNLVYTNHSNCNGTFCSCKYRYNRTQYDKTIINSNKLCNK